MKILQFKVNIYNGAVFFLLSDFVYKAILGDSLWFRVLQPLNSLHFGHIGASDCNKEFKQKKCDFNLFFE